MTFSQQSSIASELVSATTLDLSRQLEPPTNLRITDVTSTGFQLSWMVPTPELVTSISVDINGSTSVLAPDQRSLTVENLEAASRYIATVTLMSSDGQEESDQAVAVTSDPCSSDPCQVRFFFDFNHQSYCCVERWKLSPERRLFHMCLPCWLFRHSL